VNDKPQVELGWHLWCGRHLNPYRAQWPKGAGLAMLKLFDAAAKMPAVADWCKGDTNQLTAALNRFAPLCCFVPPGTMDQIYRETAPGWVPPGGPGSPPVSGPPSG
jgi:hypothetical protein